MVVTYRDGEDRDRSRLEEVSRVCGLRSLRYLLDMQMEMSNKWSDVHVMSSDECVD